MRRVGARRTHCHCYDEAMHRDLAQPVVGRDSTPVTFLDLR